MMAVLGWMLLTAIACLFGIAGVLMLAFIGRWDPENVIPLLISAVLFWVSYTYTPFTMSLVQ